MPDSVGECAVCGSRETVVALELPPRALTLMRHGKAVSWSEVAEPATVRFCEPDWKFVVELVEEAETNPLAQCNATYAEYDRDPSAAVDHLDLETTMWADASETLDGEGADGVTEQDRVAARLVTWSLETLVEANG